MTTYVFSSLAMCLAPPLTRIWSSGILVFKNIIKYFCSRCIDDGIPYKVIHNASIMNAVGCCGLQLYSFGETISMCFWDGNWRPDSYYDKIVANRKMGFHTLCLLDIKVKEQTVENLMRGNGVYEPPRFMTTHQVFIRNRSF